MSIEKTELEYNCLQDEVVELMERSAECLNTLKEIALKPNPLSTPEYIDLLIEGEKSEAKPGYLAHQETTAHEGEGGNHGGGCPWSQTALDVGAG